MMCDGLNEALLKRGFFRSVHLIVLKLTTERASHLRREKNITSKHATESFTSNTASVDDTF